MRLRSILTALAVLAATPAAAEIKTFARASGWEAFGGTTDAGKAVCGVSVEDGDAWFALKYFKGDSVLTVQLGDPDWKGKVGDKVKLAMKFDNQSPWTAEATAFALNNKELALEFSVDAKVIDDWMDEFKESFKLIINFTNAKISPWNADLKGTKVIGQAMEECVGWMGKLK